MINHYVYDSASYRNDILLTNKNNKHVFPFSALAIIFFCPKMADINKSDLFVRLYLILELSGFLLHLVGFCTPYWRSLHFKYTEDVIQDIDIVIQGFDEGIWRRCVNGICSEINVVGRGDILI